MSDTDLMKQIYAFDEKIPHDDAKMMQIIPLVKERMKTLAEFWSLSSFFFEKPSDFERAVKPELLSSAKEALKNVEWMHDAMEQAVRDAVEKAGLKARDVFMELRLAVTGKTVGPPLLESFEVLGKEEVLTRLS